jgi:prophage regulatory protein
MSNSEYSRIFLLRRKLVEGKTGLGRSTIYKLISEGEFPPPIKLTTNGAVAWKSNEIDDWIQERISQSKAWESPDKAEKRSEKQPLLNNTSVDKELP